MGGCMTKVKIEQYSPPLVVVSSPQSPLNTRTETIYKSAPAKFTFEVPKNILSQGAGPACTLR